MIYIYVYLKIFVLLYADDTVILSESRTDLQLALNVFGQYCAEWKLTVNTDKTKILIFAKGRLSKYDKYYFNGKCLEIVNEYKYLGIIFSRSGSFARTIGWLVVFGLNGPLRQYFSLYRAVSQNERERKEK